MPGMMKKKTNNFRMFYKIIQNKARMEKSMTLPHTSLTPNPPPLRLPRMTSSKWTVGARAPPCPTPLVRRRTWRTPPELSSSPSPQSWQQSDGVTLPLPIGREGEMNR